MYKELMKSLLLILLTAVLAVIVIAVPFSVAQPSGTSVGGVISSDITWTKSSSPYTLTGNLLVQKGVMLTIQPGVTVNLGSYYIMVNGTLQAIGDDTDPVTFNEGEITFTKYSSNWVESSGTGCIIQNAIINSALTAEITIKIDSSTLTGETTIKKSSIISNNLIQKMCYINSGFVINNRIQNQGIWASSGITITGNTISGTNAGITYSTTFGDEKAHIESNLIVNSKYGIVLSETQGATPNSPVIAHNTITNCSSAIRVIWLGILLPPNPEIVSNNIYGNSEYNVELILDTSRPSDAPSWHPETINATNNWWGTTDTTTIDQLIRDNQDDFYVGTVISSPFLTEPDPKAPTYTAPTTSPTPESTPKSVVPEFPIATITTAAIIAIATTSLLCTRKNRQRV
jgi:hypothetical protein